MTDVEQKVVQMRFDDKDFDEKAQKTMKTLDKLANKLSVLDKEPKNIIDKKLDINMFQKYKRRSS